MKSLAQHSLIAYLDFASCANAARSNEASSGSVERGRLHRIADNVISLLKQPLRSGGLPANAQVAAFFERGATRYKQSEYDKAIAEYAEAVRLDPRLAAAFNIRGNAWSK